MKKTLLLLKNSSEPEKINLQIHDFNIKNVYIGKLDDRVNEYNNSYHRTIKIKSTDVKTNTCIYFRVENNDKDPKIKVVDHMRI